jgi:hypothetical protein
MGEEKQVLSEEEKQKIIAEEMLREKVRAQMREEEKHEREKAVVRETATVYSNRIVGLEGMLSQEKLEGIDPDELLLFMKEGLNHYIDYQVEKNLLNPGKTNLFDDWLQHKSNEYTEGFKVLDSIIDDINPYMEKGINLIKKMAQAQVLEKLSEDKSKETLMRSCKFSFEAVIEMLNKIMLDPFRRSATYQKDILEQRLDKLAEFQNEWIYYSSKFFAKPHAVEPQAPPKDNITGYG